MAYNPQMLTARVTLTAAQIKSLHATPIQIVAGRTGQIIDLRSCFLEFIPNTTPFGTIVAGDAIALYTGNGAVNGSLVAFNGMGNLAAGLINQAVKTGAWTLPTLMTPNNSNPSVLPSVIVGGGLNITQFNQNSGWRAGTDWTTGDGSLIVYIRYAFIEA